MADIKTQRTEVRELAWRVAAIAGSAENAAICRRWCDVNDLRKPDRAPVWCRPAGAWDELLPETALRCPEPWLREWERELRMILLKHDIGDDSPVNPWLEVEAVWRCDPPDIWGLPVARHQPDRPGGAWAYDPPLKTERDFDRLVLPQFEYDNGATEAKLGRAHDLLGDILPVRVRCHPPLGGSLAVYAAELRGLSELMLDMAEAPERVHRLMAHLRDGVLGSLRQVVATGRLTPNHRGPMAYSMFSDPIAPAPADGRLDCRHLWLWTDSQELEQVSPAMWEEFCLAYQRPIVELFGRSAYGCCENLTHKIDGVLSLPNLRVFVASAWTDLDRVIEKAGPRYAIQWRQKASDVVFPDDVAAIQRHLEDGARRLRGCHYHIVLRELQTLAGHPDRLHAWTKLAIATAEKYA